MKKLVTAALALCAAAAIADGVTSANVVGMQDKTAGAGYNYITPSFVDIGYNTYKLGGIVLSGDDVEEFSDNLQIFDEGGNGAMQFLWLGGAWVDADGYLGGEDPNEYALDRGTFPIVDIQNEGDVTIKVAGEVSTNGLEVAASAGYNYIGNATQSALTLGDITLEGDDVEEFSDNLQIFDEGGNGAMQFLWLGGAWVDADGYLGGEDPNEYAFNPGDGVIVDIQNEGDVTIKVAGCFIPGL